MISSILLWQNLHISVHSRICLYNYELINLILRVIIGEHIQVQRCTRGSVRPVGILTAHCMWQLVFHLES
uniref:Uncharacterized protein n=1 Tax=Pararge aegeria TaxID=116150 RepID=S4PSR9_9NEOP